MIINLIKWLWNGKLRQTTGTHHFLSIYFSVILSDFSILFFRLFISDIYSSHTSLSYSPSLSEGATTPNSLTPHDTTVNDNNNASNENCTNFNNRKSHHRLATHEKENSTDPHTTDTGNSDTGINERRKMAKSTGVTSLPPNADTIAFASTHKMMATMTTTAAAAATTTPSTMTTTATKINGKSKLVSAPGGNNNGEGSYHCQFCDKSFPRLGYLKKHEQVSADTNSTT